VVDVRKGHEGTCRGWDHIRGIGRGLMRKRWEVMGTGNYSKNGELQSWAYPIQVIECAIQFSVSTNSDVMLSV
jgi:hypothetical protein